MYLPIENEYLMQVEIVIKLHPNDGVPKMVQVDFVLIMVFHFNSSH